MATPKTSNGDETTIELLNTLSEGSDMRCTGCNVIVIFVPAFVQKEGEVRYMTFAAQD
jgi:hypothetical protein